MNKKNSIKSAAKLLRLWLGARLFLGTFVFGVGLSGCSPFTTEPVPGPDKQSVGTMTGAAIGAGTGAVTGAQIGSGTGPGAWVGAAFGAVYGMFSGLGIDLLEEDQIGRDEQTERLREMAWAEEILAEHYARRLELHPNRDIFPADLFFSSDSTTLNPAGEVLARELGALTKSRMPWSRIVVTSYAYTVDKASPYALHLSSKRAEQIALQFIKAGIEPRRVAAQGIPVLEPILIDPDDSPKRYYQAIEIIAVDR